MSSVYGGDWDEEYSVIGEEGGVSFEDFQDDKSFLGFDTLCEGPVIVSVPFAFSNGKPRSALLSETASDIITLRNTTEEPVELWSVRIFSSNPKDAFLLSLMRPPQVSSNEEVKQAFVGSTALEDRVLQPGEVLTVWLSCKPVEIGMHTAVIHFVIGDEKIERVAFLLVDDSISQALAANKPFHKGHRRKKFDLDQYVPVSRPPSSGKQEFKYYLPKFPIPKDVRKLVENRKVPHVVLDGLNNRNYTDYFTTLLIMEEIHLEEEMRGYDMESVFMRRKGNYLLALEVPGLAERRPSIVYGDFIFAKDASYGLDGSVRPFQGYVYRVEADEVLLKFAEEFHQQHQSASLYNVSFTYNRVNMRRLYQAVRAAAELGPELLFPSEITKRRTRSRTSMVPINKSLNPEQLNCVGKILGCRGAPPYIIHGPPGTGKTMTLVEAISQVCRLDARARVLVCACSNSAADHVLEKLIGDSVVEVEESRIFRLNAPSRPFDDMKADYIPFCFFEDTIFKCPPLKALIRYKIVVSTYMSTSLLYAEHIQRGHFTHIFLDEAGQASEPETMVPIAKLCCRDTVIVLAGDPMQLGPVIFSKDAEHHGLGKSYLQRLFECDHYRDGDENYITKLVRNYRSHPAILELPSLLFYGGELIASKNETDSEIYDLINIPNKKFPVLFVGIQGCDEREGSNPSWFNRIEASKVIEIIKRLKRYTDLSEFDIGVITPYRQQVLKIKNALESLEMPDVKVGSVEQFQGQERQVIIISTVRSTVKHNEFDQIHNLGFLSNRRRFNVAVTRARSLLIIVGNPHIISKDPCWNKLLRHCADNDSYEGCPLPEPEAHHSGDEVSSSFAGNDLPVEYNDGEVVWNEDLPKQYTNEVEWDEELPKELSKEIESDELHRVYDNEAEWDEELPDQHIKEAQWKEDLLKHDEGDWNEDNLEQYIEESGWNNETAFSSTSKSEWNEDMPTECTDGGEWKKIILDQKTDEDEGSGGTPEQHTSEPEWKNYNPPGQYEDNSKENQDTVEGKAKLDQYNEAVFEKDTFNGCHEDARQSEGEVKRRPSETGRHHKTGWQKASASGGIRYVKKEGSRHEHNPHKFNKPHNSNAATNSKSNKGGIQQWRRSTGGQKQDESNAMERSFRDVRLG